MLKGRSVSAIWLGGAMAVLGTTLAAAGCGEPQSLGEEAGTGGAGDTSASGGDPTAGGEESGGSSTGGETSPGGETSHDATGGDRGAAGEPATGGVATGGASGGGADNVGGLGGTTATAITDRDYELEGIGGHYSPDTQQAAAGKLDLLFVVDNSISMADKQELLALALPQMVDRLVNPRCVDDVGVPVGEQPATGLDACPEGSVREMAPVSDMHVGVVSSSLGGHGGQICSPEVASYGEEQNDNGELIAPRRGVETAGDLGFVTWDASSPEASDVSNLAELITVVGESGCGFEAPLEAWYRFLVDPEPPLEVGSDGTYTSKQGINTTVLSQREAFLRADSAVAIVLLSDENDCSVRDAGLGWLIGGTTRRIPRGTAACIDDPNDPCCRSCALAEAKPPTGCVALSNDPYCARGQYSPTEDPLNLRCWDQKRRFGIDFLYSTDRYVRALTNDTVFRDSDGEEVPNPLYAGGQRDPSMVTFVGIVGVPWQALARNTSSSVPLRYKPALQLHDEGIWTALIGNPRDNVAPTDPFMVESIDPREGTSPVTGLSPAGVDGVSDASPVNGHEFDIPQRDDLQYACTFPLITARDCDEFSGGCDCHDDPAQSSNKPLCQAPGTSEAGTVQYLAKAYPGLRHLEVMRRIGPLAVPASICPREATDVDDPEFGYAPVVEAMLDRLRVTLE